MAKIFLTDSDTNFKIANNGSEIVGTVGIDSVSILEGVTGITLGSGVEEAAFAGDLTSYTFAQKGATLEVFNAAGELVSVLQSAIQQAPTFNGVTLKVERNAEGKMTIANGENVITLEDNAVAVAPPAIDPELPTDEPTEEPVDPELPTDEPTEEPVDPADLSVALDAYNTAKTAAKAAETAAKAAETAADDAQALSDDVDSAIAEALGKVVNFKAKESAAADAAEIKLLPASADFNNLNAEDQATAILNAKNVLKVQVSQKTAELNTANKGPAAKLANAQKDIEGAIKGASAAIKEFGVDGKNSADSALKAFATANNIDTDAAADAKVVEEAAVFSIQAADGEVIITTDANGNLIKTSASNNYEAKSVDALIAAAEKYLASLDTAETALAAAEKTLTANIDAALKAAAKPGLNYFTNGDAADAANRVDAKDVKIKLAELVGADGFVKADGAINALDADADAALLSTTIDGKEVNVALSLDAAIANKGDAVSTTGKVSIFAVDADGAITFNDAITTLDAATGEADDAAAVNLKESVSKITDAINNKEVAIKNQTDFNKEVAAWETAKDSKTPLEKAAAAAEAAKEAAELTATEKAAALAAAAEAVNEAAGEGVNVVLEATGEGEAAVFAGTVSDDLFLFGGDAITITNFNTTGGTDAIYLLGDKEYTLVNVTNEAAIAKADDDAVLQIFAYKEGSNTILAVEDKVYAGTAGEELLTNITLTGVTGDIAFNDVGNLVIA